MSDVKPGRDPRLVAAGQGFEPYRPGQAGANLSDFTNPPPTVKMRLLFDPEGERWLAVLSDGQGGQIGRRHDVTDAVAAIVAAEREKWENE